MAEDKKKGSVLSELQQLRGIVLGEYEVEVDQRLADLEHKMQRAQTDLSKAIDDANQLGANEVQAVRDLIDDRLSALTADMNKQFEAINAHLADLQHNYVDRGQLGQMLIAMGTQLQNKSGD